MPRKPISFELDFMIKDIFSRFTVKQFDDVSFNIKPKNQGLDYDTSGMTGKIFVGVNNDMFMQTSGITVSSNNINVLLDRNMLQKNGRAYAEIELTDSNGTITSSSFIFDIDPKIGEGGMIPGEYEGFAEKYERLISEFKKQVNSTINNCNSNVNNKLNTVDSLINAKVSDFEKRFYRLTSSQQKDAEVILAREDFKGQVFDSLKDRLDYTDKVLRDSTVSTVTTESDFTTVEETSNGYFEDVKLEGKTLVNLWGNKSSDFSFSGQTSFNPTTQCIEYTSTTNRFSNCCTKNTSQYKPGTKYTIVVNVMKNTFTSTSSNILKVNSDSGGTNDIGVSTETKNILGGFVGVKVFTITTSSDLSSANIGIRTYIDNINSEEGVTLKFNMIILEGDHTQNPPSFFEGLMSVGQDAEEVSVASVKGDGNLVEGDNLNILMKRASAGTAKHIKFRPTSDVVSYFVDCEGSQLNSGNVAFRFLDKNKNILGSPNYVTTSASTSFSFKFSDRKINYLDIYYVQIFWNSNLSEDTVISNLTFIAGDIAPTKHIPYQTDKKRLLYYNNETQTWEKPILRQWDSIEKHADGKYYYHKRSEEMVLNGSENWTLRTDRELENSVVLQLNGIIPKYAIDNVNIITDKFNSTTSILADEVEGIYLTKNSTALLRVNKSKLSTQDVEGFKQWLQANQTTVVYQLAQEEVYECTNIDLITYANETNYIVNSGAISPKSILKVHNNISNVVKILQEKVSLLESNIKATQEVQDMMILESDMRILDMELALMEHMPITLNLGENSILRSATYFNFIKGHIVNETYEKEYLENVMNKYLATNRLTQEEYDELYKMLYPPKYDIELPIEE